MRPLRTELHVPVGYLATTIIDGKDLIQVRTPSSHQNGVEPDYEGTFYTNDSEYVNRTSNMLKDIWKNARPPSTLALATTMLPPEPMAPECEDPLLRPNGPYQKMVVKVAGNTGLVTEKDVLNKIITAKRIPP